MLIEFSVTNFRSIKETQTLSMVAANWMKELQMENTFSTEDTKLPQLLNSVAIYGANASGKTNLIKAIRFMRSFISKSHKMQEGEEIKNIAPFLFNTKTHFSPCEFEIIFINDNVRYQYGFSANNKRITHEWLFAFPKGRRQRWFEREYNPKTQKDTWDWGDKLKGQLETIKKLTIANTLFLSKAVQNNNEQLKPIFNWFQQKLCAPRTFSLGYSAKQCEIEERKNKIMVFVKYADPSIHNIHVKKEKLFEKDLPKDMPQSLKDKILKDFLLRIKITSSHYDNEQQSVELEFDDESDGTQNFFALAGPLLDVMEKGLILVIDELNESMHPLLVRYLINLFHDPKKNKHNAQLIFSTHDTSILNTEIFRRDQIWFTEKDKDNSTQLYPLSDFGTRDTEKLNKWYLQGRYGAIPFIGELN